MRQKRKQNLQLLDILACDSGSKPSFQNPTKSLFAQRSIDVKSSRLILKRWYDNRVIDQNVQKCCICLMHIRYP